MVPQTFVWLQLSLTDFGDGILFYKCWVRL